MNDNSQYDEPLNRTRLFRSVATYQEYMGVPKKLLIIICGACAAVATFFNFNLLFAVPAFLMITVAKFIVKDDPVIFEINLKNVRYPKKLD